MTDPQAKPERRRLVDPTITVGTIVQFAIILLGGIYAFTELKGDFRELAAEVRGRLVAIDVKFESIDSDITEIKGDVKDLRRRDHNGRSPRP